MQSQPQSKKRSAWESTRHQNLVRYVPSGTIFARFKIRGKQVRRSLETKNLEFVAVKMATFVLADGVVVMSTMRKRSRVMLVPVLLVIFLRMDSVPEFP